LNEQHHDINPFRRLKIVFFDYPDVFEDFYSHYHVDQKTFSTKWHNTGSHAWLKIIQAEIGDVTWYALSIKPEFTEASTHDYTKAKVKFLRSSWLHRKLWKLFYASKNSWRLQKYYKTYASLASYTSLLSWKIFQTIRRDKPDVILAQEYSSGRFDTLYFYAKLLRIPIVTYHAGSTVNQYSGKFLRRFTIPKAGWIFASGQKELKRLEKKYKVPSKHLNIIRPPIDVEIYKPMPRIEACNEAGLKTDRRYWLFVGRLDDAVKRISAIIKTFCTAAEKHPNLDLLIIGTGNDEKKLKDIVPASFKQRIIFLGWIAEDYKKALYYNGAECLIMASLREGFPTVIGEAFACGIPVISSDVGTISDLVIHEKTGWLFTAGDDKAMQKIFQMLADDPSRFQSTAENVRKIAEENVSFEAISVALKEGFTHVTSNKK
jgi:glycosyltransferase involved in cell wall biosynthesis